MNHTEPTRREFLLVPMQPTPNGALHVGHAAGPYLRADALARHLRRSGHRVQVICGSDAYENWVLLDSLRNHRSPEETCDLFHRRIRRDLANLDMSLDDYITPLDPAHTASYARVHEEIVDGLIAGGAAQLVRERFPVSSGSGRYVVGVWLLGRCPNCGKDAAGNSCEACGYHFQPSEVLEPRARLDDEGPLTWREEDCWYATPDSRTRLLDLIEGRGAPAELVAVARRYVEQTGGRVRLTIPSAWGIKGRHTSENTVLCNTYYAYTVYCGALYHGLETGRNALAADSDVPVVALFGIDNLTGGLVAPCSIALGHAGLKPFDHVVVNYFLDLEGSKFSTSRGHLILLSDILEGSSVTADELRCFLSRIDLESGPANFTVREFVDRTNDLRELTRRLVVPALARAGAGDRPASPDAALLARIGDLLDRQARYLSPDRVSLHRAVEPLDAWFQEAQAARDERAFWWLRGLALLAEPFMPRLAGHLWTSLGGEGRPETSGLASPPARVGGPPLDVPGPLHEREVAPFVRLTHGLAAGR